MAQFYTIAAVIGGTILVCQLLMSVAGLGADHDIAAAHDTAVDHGAEGSWLFGLLAFRSIVAGITFFGLSGMATSAWGVVPSLLSAAFMGFVGLVLVAVLMRGIVALQADGTLRIQGAVGRPGAVYLTVPANNAGVGKVNVNVQDRTVELRAVTNGNELPTGSPIVVVGVVGPDTVEVISGANVARPDHVTQQPLRRPVERSPQREHQETASHG